MMCTLLNAFTPLKVTSGLFYQPLTSFIPLPYQSCKIYTATEIDLQKRLEKLLHLVLNRLGKEIMNTNAVK